MPIGFNPGVTITDEAVAVLTATSIAGSSGYYCGHVQQLTDLGVVGTLSSVLGVYSGAGRTGTRYEVIFDGAPGAGQVLWDTERGYLYAVSTHGALYCTYRGYGQFADTARVYALQIIGQMTSGVAADWARTIVAPPRTAHFTKALVEVRGNLASVTTTFEFRTASGGGGVGVSVTLGAGKATTGLRDLSATLTVQGGSPVYVRATGRGASDIAIALYEMSDL